jgi:hypothetical protein
LAPKSPNVEDYQRPGRDNTRDAGVGIKPKATVKAPAEKNPPKVIKKTAKAVR